MTVNAVPSQEAWEPTKAQDINPSIVAMAIVICPLGILRWIVWRGLCDGGSLLFPGRTERWKERAQGKPNLHRGAAGRTRSINMRPLPEVLEPIECCARTRSVISKRSRTQMGKGMGW